MNETELADVVDVDFVLFVHTTTLRHLSLPRSRDTVSIVSPR